MASRLLQNHDNTMPCFVRLVIIVFNHPVYYLPIFTTLFSVYFFVVIFRHWMERPSALHTFWWMLGVSFYGAGTVTESINTLYGYNPLNFRLWYIFGALLGGASLAQGTVYLLLKKPVAHVLTVLLVATILVSSTLIALSPLHPERAIDYKLGVKILEWSNIKYAVIFINIYAFCFLVGGAAYSAFKYAYNKLYKARFEGNLFIAAGGLLLAIGGTFTRFGYVGVLFVTEFLGIILIYAGYIIIRKESQRFESYNGKALHAL